MKRRGVKKDLLSPALRGKVRVNEIFSSFPGDRVLLNPLSPKRQVKV